MLVGSTIGVLRVVVTSLQGLRSPHGMTRRMRMSRDWKQPDPAEPDALKRQPSQTTLDCTKKDHHYDTGADFSDLSTRTMLARAGVFFAWSLFYLGVAALIGMLPAMLVFLISYIRFHGRESWKLALFVTLPTVLFCYNVFHKLLLVVWPQSVLGNIFPILRTIESLKFL